MVDLLSQGETKSMPRRESSIGVWMAISMLPPGLLCCEYKWCLQCQLVLLTTWSINVIQWCPQKINRADKEINVFKNKCIICWLVHIFTHGRVYSELDRKNTVVKLNAEAMARRKVIVPCPATQSKWLKSFHFQAPFRFSKYLYIQISFVMSKKPLKQWMQICASYYTGKKAETQEE